MTYADMASSAQNLRNQDDRESIEISTDHQETRAKPAQRKVLDGPTGEKLRGAIMQARRSGQIDSSTARGLIDILDVQASKDIPSLPKGGKGEQLQLNLPILQTTTSPCCDGAAFAAFAAQAVWTAATHATLTVVCFGEAAYSTVYLLGMRTIARREPLVHFVGGQMYADFQAQSFQRITRGAHFLKGRPVQIFGVTSFRACVPDLGEDAPAQPGIRLDRFLSAQYLPSMVALGIDKGANERAILVAIEYLNKAGYEVGYHSWKWWVFNPRSEIDDDAAMQLGGALNREVAAAYPDHGKFLYSVIRPSHKPLYLNSRPRVAVYPDTTIVYLRAAIGQRVCEAMRPVALAWLTSKGIQCKQQKKQNAVAYYVLREDAKALHEIACAFGYHWYAPEVAVARAREADKNLKASIEASRKELDEMDARDALLSSLASFTEPLPASPPPAATTQPTADTTSMHAQEIAQSAAVEVPTVQSEERTGPKLLDLKGASKFLEKKDPVRVTPENAAKMLVTFAAMTPPEVEMANQPDYVRFVEQLDRFAPSLKDCTLDKRTREWLLHIVMCARNSGIGEVTLGNECALVAGKPSMVRQRGV
jgi:hypothetical protein